MKKCIIILATLALSLAACADRHQLISYSELPMQAQVFVQTHFNSADVMHVERERDGAQVEYNVYLKNNIEIEFNHLGALKSIDCNRSAIPDSILPELIRHYVAYYFPENIIVEYIVGPRRMTVELNNGLELYFDHEGTYLGMDD